MGDWLEDNYWRFGFRSRLYDLLTPESYIQSLESCLDCLSPLQNGRVWLDAGCGSGMLIDRLHETLARGGFLVATDLLFSGLRLSRAKAKYFKLENRVLCFQSNLTEPLPIKPGSIDAVIAHFSLYTLPEREQRISALQHVHSVLRTGGELVLVNPSLDYNAARIIQDSLRQVQFRCGAPSMWWKRYIYYPLTYWFGLRFIERQLRRGNWKAFTIDEMCQEVEDGGFTVKHTESVYSLSAILVKAEAR
ncbi:MAG: hypothetical protein COV67_07975 [Nitrospinae bacterium CG11_big_fil_rev_8_21_14_0_20_56_8]|nr:MAG: hypothetical protein COV67_07975 [Nitrospinae bacterium CG11_big_fil_rev_8_21_14_0_20_56_8]